MSTDPFKNENPREHSQAPGTTPPTEQQNPAPSRGSADSQESLQPPHTAYGQSQNKAEDTHVGASARDEEQTTFTRPASSSQETSQNAGQPVNPGQDRHPRTGHLNLPGQPGEHLNAQSPESLPPQNSYAMPHTLPGQTGYAVPNPAAYPYTAYPSNPHDEIVRKRSLMYLLRLCIVGSLVMLGLVVMVLGLIGGIIDLNECGTGSYAWSEYSQRTCREENTSAIVTASFLILVFIAYPICHIFGWLAVKNNQHAIRVRVISIVGIVLSSLGLLLALLMLLVGLGISLTLGPTGLFAIFLLVVITGAIPVAELIFSIIFLKHSLWMTRDNVFKRSIYQLP